MPTELAHTSPVPVDTKRFDSDLVQVTLRWGKLEELHLDAEQFLAQAAETGAITEVAGVRGGAAKVTPCT